MKDLTEGNPLKLILSLAIPMLIGNIFQQIYSITDTIIVGRYLGEEALAGVGSTGTLTSVLICFLFGLGTGASLIIAQAFGQKAYIQLKKTIVALIYTGIILSTIIALLGTVLCMPLLRILSVPEDVIDYSAAYLRIIFIFVYASVAYNASAGILRSLGDTKTPLFALIISCLSNIALDIIFIILLNLGVKGAAFATVISQALSAFYCIRAIYRKRELLGFDSVDFKPELDYVKKIVSTGFPSALQSCMISFGSLSVQRLINSYGSSAMAGFVAANKVDSITIQIVIAICSALSIYTGQNMGKGNMERIKKGMYQTLVVMVSICICLAVIVPSSRYYLMGIFLDKDASSEAIEIGALYLSIIGIAYIIAGVMNTYLNVLKGAGDVNTCMIAGLTELSGKILFAYVLSGFLGIKGIWIATPVSWGCGCIIPVLRYYSGKWTGKRLI